jgi:molybdopterin-guanine dinucleotide biosynthesis protein A
VTSIKGLILAGGESQRMGADKSVLNYHGKSQREFLFDMLTAYCTKVHTSCKADQKMPPELNPITDKFDLRSPLNGILSALSFDSESAWLSIPVDMPFITDDVVKFLIANRDPETIATCFYDSDGQDPEPLFAIWEPKGLSHMMEYYRSGKNSVRGFLQRQPIRLLKSPDPRMHVNINSPEDFQRFRKP